MKLAIRGNSRERFRISKKKLLLFVPIIFASFLLVIFAGCSPRQSEERASGEEADMVLTDFAWSVESDCEMCHIQEMESREDNKFLASTHAENACIDCHSDEAGLTDVHEDVDTAEDPEKGRLWSTAIDDSTCISCHSSWEELATITADDTTLTDAQGLTINPHQIPEGGDHGDITCASCHVMHTYDPSVIRRQCISCHHAEVWECGTCHTYVKSDVEAE